MFDMHFDLTNMYVFKVNIFKIEASRTNKVTKITKPMFVARTTTMMDFYMETASMLHLMKDQPIPDRFTSILYAIRDNRFEM